MIRRVNLAYRLLGKAQSYQDAGRRLDFCVFWAAVRPVVARFDVLWLAVTGFGWPGTAVHRRHAGKQSRPTIMSAIPTRGAS